MRNIHEYSTARAWADDQLSKLWEENGAFFAFSNAQFAEKAKEGVQYVALVAGLIAPKENAKHILERMVEIQKAQHDYELEHVGVRKIIERELWNHECFYTGEIEDAVDAVEGYGITAEQVAEVYRDMRAKGQDGE